MNIKGSTYVTTKAIIIQAFGQERWNSFLAKVVEKDKYFSKMIMSVTLIPVNSVIIFFDEMCREFFNNDKMQYTMFGKAGAKFVLSPEGPYRSYMLAKDINQFVELYMPKIWSTYFDGGVFTAKFVNNIVHIKITGVEEVKNFYFEELIMGYNQQALKLFGKKSIVKRVRSISSGDDDIYFQLEIKNS
jgi:hypothetical protein